MLSPQRWEIRKEVALDDLFELLDVLVFFEHALRAAHACVFVKSKNAPKLIKKITITF